MSGARARPVRPRNVGSVRRDLQRLYLNELIQMMLSPAPGTPEDARALARATLGQMVVRIALQCNEADAALIMDDNNPAPRLLSRPGEAIYNDEAGAVTGNSPFQTVWVSDTEREEWLAKVSARTQADGVKRPAPVSLSRASGS